MFEITSKKEENTLTQVEVIQPNLCLCFLCEAEATCFIFFLDEKKNPVHFYFFNALTSMEAVTPDVHIRYVH